MCEDGGSGRFDLFTWETGHSVAATRCPEPDSASSREAGAVNGRRLAEHPQSQ